MRSLFWRILASFWLAIALVAGLSILLGHMLNQDAWILSRHPVLSKLPQSWTERYEAQGADAAQDYLQSLKRKNHMDVQVLNDTGDPVVRGTFSPRAAALEARRAGWAPLPPRYTRGVLAKYSKLVQSAAVGAVTG